jgi:hypothetical protein
MLFADASPQPTALKPHSAGSPWPMVIGLSIAAALGTLTVFLARQRRMTARRSMPGE